MKKLTVLGMCIVLMLGTSSFAVILNDFEGTAGNAVDWSNGLSVDDPSNMPSKYNYDTIGATSGSQSLKMTAQGWGQTLAFKLTEAQRADFMANSIFSIDYSVAADTLGVGGYARIQGIVINADGLGWTGTDLGDTQNYWFWDGSPERTQTLEFDYSAMKGSISPNPGYIEIILETNGQRDTSPASPFEMYFDNAQLIPEPATLSLLGLGAVALLRRKK